MQLFVRGLDSRSLSCNVESTASVADVKRCIEDSEGIPSCSQGLVFAGRQLQDERSLESYGVCPHSTLSLVLRLRGGKGGFGALLRGLGRDGSKTTNDDAMRDLQGRRLKHANAEKKLKEWESKAKERELEKVALAHIKQQEREARKEDEKKVEVDVILKQQKDNVARVQDAVKDALAASKPSSAAAGAGAAAPGKRAATGAAAPAAKQPAPKKPRGMLAALESFGSEDEDESSEEQEEEKDE